MSKILSSKVLFSLVLFIFSSSSMAVQCNNSSSTVNDNFNLNLLLDGDFTQGRILTGRPIDVEAYAQFLMPTYFEESTLNVQLYLDGSRLATNTTAKGYARPTILDTWTLSRGMHSASAQLTLLVITPIQAYV